MLTCLREERFSLACALYMREKIFLMQTTLSNNINTNQNCQTANSLGRHGHPSLWSLVESENSSVLVTLTVQMHTDLINLNSF